LLAVTLPRYLKDHFQLDRGAERKACDSIHQATRTLVVSEYVLQQLRSSVRDFRLFADTSRSGHSAPAGPDSPRIISALPFGFVLMFISFSKLPL
jgi:hypothetical protein